jgi:hypothetical protein
MPINEACTCRFVKLVNMQKIGITNCKSRTRALSVLRTCQYNQPRLTTYSVHLETFLMHIGLVLVR